MTSQCVGERGREKFSARGQASSSNLEGAGVVFRFAGLEGTIILYCERVTPARTVEIRAEDTSQASQPLNLPRRASLTGGGHSLVSSNKFQVLF